MKVKKILFFSIILMVTFILGVKASSLIYGKDVTYDNTSSGLKSTTVQGALDELYEKAKNSPSCNSDGECTVSCPSGKTFISTDNGYKCISLSVNEKIVTSGDGLYTDSTEKGRYIYRGSNPNNYITFNNETWRIISIESDGTLKIVRNEQLSSTYQWDATGNRSNLQTTYCTNVIYGGCNAWASNSNLINTPSNFTQYSPNGNISDSTNYTGKVANDSTMATYLNGTYYNSLSSAAKAKVVKGTFNVSTPGYNTDTESLETDAKQEKQYQWKGYVALYTITELLRASTTSGCSSLKVGYNGGGSNGPCSQNNWLWQGFNSNSLEWTLSPFVFSTDRAWIVYSSGHVDGDSVTFYIAIRPVLHLSSNITLSGTGSSSDPYVIN